MKKRKDPILLWQQHEGIELFQKMGLSQESRLLDFGCSVGNYTLPAARLLSRSTVYALDHNPGELKKAMLKVRRMQIDNLCWQESFQQSLEQIEPQSVDCILLYDVIHSLPRRKTCLSAIKTLLKKDGFLSILPFHMSRQQISLLEKELEELGFQKTAVYPGAGIHFEMHRYTGSLNDPIERYEHGDILNFARKG